MALKQLSVFLFSILFLVFECHGSDFKSHVYLGNIVGEAPSKTYFDDEGHLYLKGSHYRLSISSPHPITRSRPHNKFVCDGCEYAIDDKFTGLIQNFLKNELNGESFHLLLREMRSRLELQFPLHSVFFNEIMENTFQVKENYTSELGTYLNDLDNILFAKVPYSREIKFPVTFRYLDNEDFNGYGISLFLSKDDLRAIKNDDYLKKLITLGVVFSALKHVFRGMIYKYSCHLEVDENRVNSRLIHLLSKKGSPDYFDKVQFKRFVFKREYEQVLMISEAIKSNFPLIITFLKKGLQNKNDRGVSGDNSTYVKNQKALTEFLSRIINNIESAISYPNRIGRLARVDDPDIPKPLKCHPFFSVLSKPYVIDKIRNAIKKTKKANGFYDTKALEALGDSLKALAKEALVKMDKTILTY